MAARFKLGFLINPVSGGGLGMQCASQLPQIMASFGFEKEEWQAFFTRQVGTEKQIRELLNKSAKVIVVGGDGTIGMVLEEIRQFMNGPEIGFIPLGTGNDLARSLGVWKVYHQKGLLACLKRLIKAPSTQFDLWEINKTHTMAAYFSMGVDGAILHDVDSLRKRNRLPRSALLNKLLYVKFFLSRARYKIRNNAVLSLYWKGKTTQMSLKHHVACIVGNISSYAGGARPFIHNNFTDRALEVHLFNNFSDYLIHNLLARIMPSAIKKRNRAFQAERLHISGLKGEFIQIDGENFSFDRRLCEISVQHANKVNLLDLRRPPFSVF